MLETGFEKCAFFPFLHLFYRCCPLSDRKCSENGRGKMGYWPKLPQIVPKWPEQDRPEKDQKMVWCWKGRIFSAFLVHIWQITDIFGPPRTRGFRLCTAFKRNKRAHFHQGPTVYALYAHYGFTRKQNGILFIAGFGCSMVVGTFAGSMADKYGRRLNCIMYGIIYCICCITNIPLLKVCPKVCRGGG